LQQVIEAEWDRLKTTAPEPKFFLGVHRARAERHLEGVPITHGPGCDGPSWAAASSRVPLRDERWPVQGS
jgi:hypothetical protein